MSPGAAVGWEKRKTNMALSARARPFFACEAIQTAQFLGPGAHVFIDAW